MSLIKKIINKHNENQQEEYFCYLKFCELLKDLKVGEYVYCFFDNKYHKFLISDDLFCRDIHHIGKLTCYEVCHFPVDLSTDAWFDISFKDIMKYSASFMYEDEVKHLIDEHKKNLVLKKEEVALKIKKGLYHNVYKSPIDPSYLLNVERIYKCNNSFYYDVYESDLIKSKVLHNTYEVPVYFFNFYQEGDGVEELSPNKQTESYNGIKLEDSTDIIEDKNSISYCSEEQTIRAHKLGMLLDSGIASGGFGVSARPFIYREPEPNTTIWNNSSCWYCPTIQEMLNWLEEKGFKFSFNKDETDSKIKWEVNKDKFCLCGKNADHLNDAKLIAINAALDHLEKKGE